MSIFTALPPSFTKSEIKNIVFNIFGLKVEVKMLESDRDQNFYLSNNNAEEFVLKIYNPSESIDIINMHTNVLDHIQKYSSDFIEAPKIINTIDGAKVGRIINNNIEYILRLVTYINGIQFKDIDKESISYSQLGSFIGRLDGVLESFSDPSAKRIFPWDIKNIDFLRKHSKIFNDKKKETIISYYIKEYEKNILPKQHLLRKRIIHNDCNDHNIIVNNDNKIKGIIDFGDMVYTYVAGEPAVCIAYAVLGKNKPFSIAGRILKGFCKTYPLLEDEINSIIYLVCIRLSISVTMAKYRSEIFPENKYLMVSNIKAWEFLYYMYEENLGDWSDRLVKYVRV